MTSGIKADHSKVIALLERGLTPAVVSERLGIGLTVIYKARKKARRIK